MNATRSALLLVLLALGLAAAQQQEITIELPGGVGLEMIWVPPGTFTMGAPLAEANPQKFEGPQRQVTITQGGYLGKYELTQEQWESVMGTRPWAGLSYIIEHPRAPATYLSWDNSQEFIAKLNEAKSIQNYRLPTEAEWEYACRAGTITPWSFGVQDSAIVDYAWSHNNTWPFEPWCHEVGLKLPNNWGFYDMHGNAWEWVQDWYGDYETAGGFIDPQGNLEGVYRVTRGGIFIAPAKAQRSASRDAGHPWYQEGGAGFRLWREGAVFTAVEENTWGGVKAGTR
ncbi:MAG: formylglycine-generating enzyme family protein [Candidatus Handelsmanbacteria bacterium]|nr:formylglycine-generating enzyme family protein [Candidatus Handelsmanbacteria bacterium]